MQEKVLLFNFKEGSQLQAIRMVFFLMQIPIVVIPKEKYGMPLKMLISDEVPSTVLAGNDKELDGQMIVFAGISGEKLDKLLSLLRSNPACGKIPYKAILTEMNQNWNAFVLLKELQKEHAAMHGEN